MNTLDDLPAGDLIAHLYDLRKDERTRLVEFLRYLAVVDRRKIAIEAGYGSVWAFCTEYLGLSKGTTYRRITSAQLIARFPMIEEYLADGRLSARTLSLLRDVLDEARLIEILDRAAGRTEDQVKELVAALRPQPAQPDLFRRLPAPPSPRRGPIEQTREVAAPLPRPAAIE